MGWALIGILIAATLLCRLLVFRVHPDLLNERASSLDAENAKPWDKVLAPAMGLTPLFVLVVAGLDQRYQWSPPLGVGLHGFLAGLLLEMPIRLLAGFFDHAFVFPPVVVGTSRVILDLFDGLYIADILRRLRVGVALDAVGIRPCVDGVCHYRTARQHKQGGQSGDDDPTHGHLLMRSAGGFSSIGT
jgi:hypothetical protein